MKWCVYVGKKILWWDPHLLISLSDSHIIYKDIRYIFFFFFLSLLISYWTFVSTNHWFSMHRPLPFSLEQRHYLAPDVGRQNAVICMKLSTQVSTSVLSRGPTRKERGEVLLPYWFLKGRDNAGKNSLWHRTCIENTRKLRHWYK